MTSKENNKYALDISIIIPVYNDQEVMEELETRLVKVLLSVSSQYEIVFVDDGSSDCTWEKVALLKEKNDRIVGIKLIRNFGQHNAISAGLDFVSGNIVIIMDSDLQDRPEDIPKLLDALIKNNASMAIARWKSRKDSWLKMTGSKLFYFISSKLTKLNYQSSLGVFRAVRKEVVSELKKYPEKTATTLSLLYWIGFDYVTVELERDERFAGESGYSFRKMLKLMLDRVFSFSMFPIRLAIFSGLTISLISFIVVIILIIRRLHGVVAPGWTSITVLILFLFGLNFLFLGIIGEYLGRIFMESKQRPKYIIKEILK
jgi:dolichol-phosphate mannosyltransferase